MKMPTKKRKPLPKLVYCGLEAKAEIIRKANEWECTNIQALDRIISEYRNLDAKGQK